MSQRFCYFEVRVINAMTKTYIDDIPDAAARVNMTEEAFTAMLRK